MFGSIAAGLRQAGRVLDLTRRWLLNALLLAVIVAAALWWWRSLPAPLLDKTVLVVDLQGTVREQFIGPDRAALLGRLRGGGPGVTRLRDLRAALDAAAAEPRIGRVLLLTDDFAGAGPATLREIAQSLQRLRAAGKPVLAWAEHYSQAGYYLAAHADAVWLDPMGFAALQGYGRARNYYRSAFERFGVSAHVLRAGRFKNAGETWVADGPSPETTEADRLVLDALWTRYAGDVESARKLPPGTLSAMLEALPERLAQAGGDAAALARSERLVDELRTRDDVRRWLTEQGAASDDGKTFRQIGWREWLDRAPQPKGEPAVAVVVAQGGIGDGRAGPGRIGGRSTAELIRGVREDEGVKALVLRVDSPGGSAFGSELVRRELELVRAAGKPVIVSMGDVAASGGYWISMASDEVVADPSTLTGSIGVVAVLLGVDRALERLGVHVEGYTTSWLAQGFDPRRPLDPRLQRVIQSGVDHVYGEFTARAAKARGRTPAEIDTVAQGRIWTGEQALSHGLVDRMGGLDDALKTAAQRAGLADGAWRARYVEVEPGRLERLWQRLAGRLPGLDALHAATLPAPFDAALAELAPLLEAAGSRAGAPLAHCLCAPP